MKPEPPRRDWPAPAAGTPDEGNDPVRDRSAPVRAQEFLERYQRQARGMLLAWSLGVTLGTLALQGAARLGWLGRDWDFLPGALAVAAALLGAWFWRVRRMSVRGLASGLDGRWDLRARLESAVELAHTATPLAVAQRADADRHLSQRRPPGWLGWLGACLLVALVSLGLLAFGGALGWRAVQAKWAERPAPEPAKTTVDQGAGAAEHAAGPAADRISIEWKSPQSEISATTIEEVPLVAWLRSDEEIRAASLEIVVNGTRAVSRPLDASAWSAAAQAGGRELRPSLYLDELDVKPFDLVSYRLAVELAGPAGSKVSSPPQFVQIRPARRDVALTGGSSELVVLLMRMKGAQLDLLKQNFALQQLAADGSDPTWATENSRVAAEQTALVDVADRAIGLARAGNPPELVTRNLTDARGLMAKAGSGMTERKNARALPLQERALALVTELQQFIQQSLQGGAAADPFADREKFELPPRAGSPAGELEALAERQRQNNEKLSDRSPPAGVAAEQAAIAHGVEALQAGGGFDPEVQALLMAAAGAARETTAQLAANDPAAARVPAAAAQRALDQAQAAQEKLGRASAGAALDRLRRTLNAAVRTDGPHEWLGHRQEWRTALRALASGQQRVGPALVARELAALESRSDEPGPALVRAAAQTQVLLMARGAALTRAIRPLRRVGTDLGTAAAHHPGLEDLEIASQEAEWLTTEAATGARARKLATQADGLLRSEAGGAAAAQAAGRGALELATALESGGALAPDAATRLFNPAEIDPRYRAAVENYFERLSRGSRPPPAAAP